MGKEKLKVEMSIKMEDEYIDRRKVLITYGMSNDKMLIITDAPQKAIENWCSNYVEGLENGQNEYFNPLKKEYYVKVLHDSEEDDNENIDIIGYDEIYDLNEYYKDI